VQLDSTSGSRRPAHFFVELVAWKMIPSTIVQAVMRMPLLANPKKEFSAHQITLSSLDLSLKSLFY
jgi:hypothetical protein